MKERKIANKQKNGNLQQTQPPTTTKIKRKKTKRSIRNLVISYCKSREKKEVQQKQQQHQL